MTPPGSYRTWPALRVTRARPGRMRAYSLRGRPARIRFSTDAACLDPSDRIVSSYGRSTSGLSDCAVLYTAARAMSVVYPTHGSAVRGGCGQGDRRAAYGCIPRAGACRRGLEHVTLPAGRVTGTAERWIGSFSRRNLASLPRRRRQAGQTYHELAALSEAGTASLDGSPVQLDEVLHERQANAQSSRGAIEGRIRLHEQVEDQGHILRGDAYPVVLHPDHDQAGAAGVRVDSQPDLSAARRKLRRVVEQVAEDLLQPDHVGLQVDAPGGQRERQDLSALVDVVLARFDGPVHDRQEVDRLLPEL